MASNYFRDMYGPRGPEFIDGVIAGVEAYAIWKDGKQLVGIMQVPLEEAIAEIRVALSDPRLEQEHG